VHRLSETGRNGNTALNNKKACKKVTPPFGISTKIEVVAMWDNRTI
jgi:hypothetical protein